MPLWLGNPGAVVQLPSPKSGLDPTSTVPVTVRQTIGGGQAVSRAPGSGRRTYQALWPWIEHDAYSVLEEFRVGARGTGPHALLDSGRRNVLSANQSASTAASYDADGFTVDPTEAVTSSNELLYGSSVRSLKWSLPDVSTAGVLRFDPPAGIPGIPAPAGQPWTFSVQLAGGGVDGTVTVAPGLLWMDAAGVAAGVTVGAPVVLTAGIFAAAYVTAATPLSACFQPALLVDLTTVSPLAQGPGDVPVRRAPWTMPVKRAANVGPLPYPINVYRPTGVYAADIYVARPMLDMYAAVRAWVLGTGVPRVSVTALTENYPALPGRAVTATFVEAG